MLNVRVHVWSASWYYLCDRQMSHIILYHIGDLTPFSEGLWDFLLVILNWNNAKIIPVT